MTHKLKLICICILVAACSGVASRDLPLSSVDLLEETAWCLTRSVSICKSWKVQGAPSVSLRAEGDEDSIVYWFEASSATGLRLIRVLPVIAEPGGSLIHPGYPWTIRKVFLQQAGDGVEVWGAFCTETDSLEAPEEDQPVLAVAFSGEIERDEVAGRAPVFRRVLITSTGSSVPPARTIRPCGFTHVVNPDKQVKKRASG